MVILSGVELIILSYDKLLFLFSAWLLPITVDSNPKDLEVWLKTEPRNLYQVPPPAQPAFFTPYPTSAFLNLPPSFIFSRALCTPACMEVVCLRILNTHPAVSHHCDSYSSPTPPFTPKLLCLLESHPLCDAAWKSAFSDPKESKGSLGHFLDALCRWFLTLTVHLNHLKSFSEIPIPRLHPRSIKSEPLGKNLWCFYSSPGDSNMQSRSITTALYHLSLSSL